MPNQGSFSDGSAKLPAYGVFWATRTRDNEMSDELPKFEREPEISRWLVSFHEAAHAVLGEVFGLRVKSLRVLSRGDGTAKIATATHLSVPDQIALSVW